jgi:hypothetical protein
MPHSKFGCLLGSLLCAVLFSMGTISAQPPAKPSGRDLQVELTNAVKAKKAKEGDTVTAVTLSSLVLSKEVVVPVGAKVVGHVRKVEADSGDGHTSFITLSFEEIDIKKGQGVPLNCFVRAALMPAVKGIYGQEIEHGSTAAPISMDAPVRAASGPGSMAPSVVDANNPYVDRNPQYSTGAQGDPKSVAAHSGQVVGMRGVELEVTVPNNWSTFKSAHKNLELGEGLQLMLVVLQ